MLVGFLGRYRPPPNPPRPRPCPAAPGLRRCVQREDQPIILTGYAALNRLLGRDVYTSHMQVGGGCIECLYSFACSPACYYLIAQGRGPSWLHCLQAVACGSPARLTAGGLGSRAERAGGIPAPPYSVMHFLLPLLPLPLLPLPTTAMPPPSLQLGGPKVMGANGVSHHIVEDDLAGAACVLRWLAYTPARVGEPAAALPTADPVARHIDYRPGEGALRRAGRWPKQGAQAAIDCLGVTTGCNGCRMSQIGPCWPGIECMHVDAPSFAGEKLDPRAAIAGLELLSPPGHSPSDSAWQSGLFDRGSWMEAQVGLACRGAALRTVWGAARAAAHNWQGHITGQSCSETAALLPTPCSAQQHLPCAPNHSCSEQAGWARTVVTGRARLGGVPVGVIAVETQVGWDDWCWLCPAGCWGCFPGGAAAPPCCCSPSAHALLLVQPHHAAASVLPLPPPFRL